MTETWPFEEDADRADPLTALRIAVTSSHPRWYYLVSFDRESESRPTDAEAAMLASFLDEYKHHWYNPRYLATLAERDLDVDGGANGVIFHKWAEDDWGFRRHSYEYGWLWSVPWPRLRAEYPKESIGAPWSLARLMDRIHTIGDKQPIQHWLDWKAAHPEVFGAVES